MLSICSFSALPLDAVHIFTYSHKYKYKMINARLCAEMVVCTVYTHVCANMVDK